MRIEVNTCSTVYYTTITSLNVLFTILTRGSQVIMNNPLRTMPASLHTDDCFCGRECGLK